MRKKIAAAARVDAAAFTIALKNRLQFNSALFILSCMRSKQSAAKPSLLLDQQLCFSLYAASMAMNRLYRKLLKPLGLTYSQYLVMLVLWEQDQLTVSDIGARLFLDSATLTPLLKRLEALQLVSRTRDPRDERQVIVALTAAGAAMRHKAQALPRGVLRAARCSQEELAQIREQIDTLRVNLMNEA